MKIGILGTGMVGQALGSGFIKKGYEVLLGGREAGNEKAAAWAAAHGERARGGSFAEAAAFGETVALCTLWSGTENALRLAGDGLAGKVIIDATNPLVFGASGPPSLALGHTDSGGEQIQRWVPESLVVKAFNIVPAPLMVDPDLPGGPPDMLIGGNDEAAKAKVTAICREFGWGVIDLGDISAARLLEPLCIISVVYGFRTGTWDHAFKLLRK